MKIEESIKCGFAKKIQPQTERAKSLFASSEQAIQSAKEIILKENTLKTIFGESYECLRQYCEAIGYLKGYKFLSHEAITYFIEEILQEREISVKFDRYRKLRNQINYYGLNIHKETVAETLQEIPTLLERLKKYSQSSLT